MRMIPACGLTPAGGLGSGDLFLTSGDLGFFFDTRLSDRTTGGFNSLDGAGRCRPDLQVKLGGQFTIAKVAHMVAIVE